jgi:hypothetical protein
MPGSGWTPAIVPYGADQTAYVVVDSFGANGKVYRETEVERTDLETIVDDFMTGQFNSPVRVVAFNPLRYRGHARSRPYSRLRRHSRRAEPPACVAARLITASPPNPNVQPAASRRSIGVLELPLANGRVPLL